MSKLEATTVIDFLKTNKYNDEGKSITSGKIAEILQCEPKHVSWALSSQFKNGKPTLLRRSKALTGRGWVYWIATRSAKPKSLRKWVRAPGKAKPLTKKLAPGIGIYFCRDDGEDIVLTFKEAQAMYDQLNVVFG